MSADKATLTRAFGCASLLLDCLPEASFFTPDCRLLEPDLIGCIALNLVCWWEAWEYSRRDGIEAITASAPYLKDRNSTMQVGIWRDITASRLLLKACGRLNQSIPDELKNALGHVDTAIRDSTDLLLGLNPPPPYDLSTHGGCLRAGLRVQDEINGQAVNEAPTPPVVSDLRAAALGLRDVVGRWQHRRLPLLERSARRDLRVELNFEYARLIDPVPEGRKSGPQPPDGFAWNGRVAQGLSQEQLDILYRLWDGGLMRPQLRKDMVDSYAKRRQRRNDGAAEAFRKTLARTELKMLEADLAIAIQADGKKKTLQLVPCEPQGGTPPADKERTATSADSSAGRGQNQGVARRHEPLKKRPEQRREQQEEPGRAGQQPRRPQNENAAGV